MPNTDKDLARAKRVRDRKLTRMTLLFQACTCMWPIKRWRSRSTHHGECPADALYLKFAEEDEDARAELDG